MFKLTIFLATTLVIIGCGKQNASSQLNVDIDLPKSAYNSEKISETIEIFMEASQRGEAQYSVSQFFDILSLTEKEKVYISKKRPGKMTIVCKESGSCTANNRGNAFEFTASKVNLPGIGVGKFIVANNVSIKLKVFSRDLVKICKVSGVKVQKSIFKVNMDGATISRNSQGFSVVTDAGMGGSYPSNECD